MRDIRKVKNKALFLGASVVVLLASLAFANFGEIASWARELSLLVSQGKNLPNSNFRFCITPAAETKQICANRKYGAFTPAAENQNNPAANKTQKKIISVQSSSIPPQTNEAQFPPQENNYFKNGAESAVYKTISRELKIITGSLPSAIVEEEYFVRFSALGGSSPYKWDLPRGTLPEGIRFDKEEGVLHGIPLKGEAANFTIKATDAGGCAACCDFDLVVLEANLVSIVGKDLSITTKSLSPAMVGKDYYEQLTAEGGILPYKWGVIAGVLPANLTLRKNTGVLYGVPQEETLGEFVVEVTDAEGNCAEKKLELAVKTSPLYITTGSLPDGITGVFYFQKIEAQGGEPPYRWQIISGSLPEGIAFELPAPQTVSSLPSSNGVYLSGAPLKSDKAAFKIKALDEKGNYDIAEFSINIAQEPLEITTTALNAGIIGMNYYFCLSAQGGEPPYCWSLDSNSRLPCGINLNSQTGTISGAPLENCSSKITFLIMDCADREASKILELAILNSPLTIEELLSFKLRTGGNFYHYISVSGGLPPYIWEVAGGELPVGISLDKETGLLNGAPQKAGEFYADIKVTDRYLETASEKFYFDVGDEELVIKTTALPAMKKDEKFSFYFEAQGGVPPYKWAVKSGYLPKGNEFNEDGLLSGESCEAGAFKIEAEVMDYAGNKVSSWFSFTVTDDSFFIKTEALPEGLADGEYDFQLEADGGTKPYSWRIISGGLPAGLSLKEDTGALSGAACMGQISSVVVEAEDKEGRTARKNFCLKIDGGELDFITAELTAGNAGEPYSCQLSARGGIYPYVWKIVTGCLPEGLSLDKRNGLISGVPQNEFDEILEIEVSDEEGQFRRAVFNLTIAKNDQPLSVATNELPCARIDKYYEAELKAVGGKPPYVWSVEGGVLPEGFNLEAAGKIIGETKCAGEFSFDIKVKDKNNSAAVKSFVLSVKDAPSSVKDFIACASDGKIGLAWTVPENCRTVKIFRSADGLPKTPQEGTLIYEGKEDNIADKGLANSVVYYYSAFAFDEEEIFSSLTNDSCGSAMPRAVSLDGERSPYIDEVVSFNPLGKQAFGSSNMPQAVLGPPKGMGQGWGSADVVSLNAKANAGAGADAPYGGTITVKFADNIVVNEAGYDFTVFENVFFIGGNPEARWMEPAVVEVSQDGKNFYRFEIDFVPHYNGEGINCNNPYCYSKGFAGVNPVYSNNGFPDPRNPSVSGGDGFDLSDITTKNLKWINYVRITSAGDNWITDCNGDKVRHTADMGALSGDGSSGFDLDSVCAVNY